jgi:hypothetical protein
MTAATDDGGPLPVVLEARGMLALDAAADHNAGLVTLVARAWPWARIALAPEVALEMARQLVRAVGDLTRGPRP